jgi:hypothetical protein
MEPVREIDNFICDVATSYVVETDISKLVALDGPMHGYVSRWDIVQAMGYNDEEDNYRPTATGGAVSGRAAYLSLSVLADLGEALFEYGTVQGVEMGRRRETGVVVTMKDE